jgi:hypothetical protein
VRRECKVVCRCCELFEREMMDYQRDSLRLIERIKTSFSMNTISIMPFSSGQEYSEVFKEETKE